VSGGCLEGWADASWQRRVRGPNDGDRGKRTPRKFVSGNLAGGRTRSSAYEGAAHIRLAAKSRVRNFGTERTERRQSLTTGPTDTLAPPVLGRAPPSL